MTTIIDYNGVKPRLHEDRLAVFLASCGHRVKFLPTSNEKNVRTPDFILDDNFAWEAKTLTKARSKTIQHALSTAVKQSENIVFDLRALGAEQSDRSEAMIVKMFGHFRRARRLMIITKAGELHQYNK